jgi:kynurenine 3-monooxygenase
LPIMKKQNTTSVSTRLALDLHENNVVISGAGPTGLALALCLAKLNISSVILERRSDEELARYEYVSGREIGLDVSKRGRTVLDHLNLLKDVEKQSIPMYFRIFHEVDGQNIILNYGYSKEDNILSITRSTLHGILLDAVKNSSNCKLFTDVEVINYDSTNSALHVYDHHALEDLKINTLSPIIACDGVFSKLRSNLEKASCVSAKIDPIPQLYKSFNISNCRELDPHAMHVWARGAFAFVAQPVAETRFAAALLLNGNGDPSFDSLQEDDQIAGFFDTYFPDLKRLIPDWLDQYKTSKCGEIYSIYLNRWHIPPHLLLMGDAAHGMAPFFGQGVNSGFEDALVFSRLLAESLKIRPRKDAFTSAMIQFNEDRLPDGHAITRMSRENYPELVKPDTIHSLYLRKEIERFLADAFPDKFLLTHNLVCFDSAPYHIIETIKEEGDKVVNQLLETASSIDDIDMEYAGELIEEYCKTHPAPSHNEEIANSSFQ